MQFIYRRARSIFGHKMADQVRHRGVARPLSWSAALMNIKLLLSTKNAYELDIYMKRFHAISAFCSIYLSVHSLLIEMITVVNKMADLVHMRSRLSPVELSPQKYQFSNV